MLNVYVTQYSKYCCFNTINQFYIEKYTCLLQLTSSHSIKDGRHCTGLSQIRIFWWDWIYQNVRLFLYIIHKNITVIQFLLWVRCRWQLFCQILESTHILYLEKRVKLTVKTACGHVMLLHLQHRSDTVLVSCSLTLVQFRSNCNQCICWW